MYPATIAVIYVNLLLSTAWPIESPLLESFLSLSTVLARNGVWSEKTLTPLALSSACGVVRRLIKKGNTIRAPKIVDKIKYFLGTDKTFFLKIRKSAIKS